jgi:hypothetical protein
VTSAPSIAVRIEQSPKPLPRLSDLPAKLACVGLRSSTDSTQNARDATAATQENKRCLSFFIFIFIFIFCFLIHSVDASTSQQQSRH